MSKQIELTDSYCNMHPNQFHELSDAKQIDWQIRYLFDKLDEVIQAVNELNEPL